MKKQNWSNTILVAFSSLQKINKTLDFSMKNKVYSGFGSKHLKFGEQNLDLFNSMLDIIDKKRRICNLHFLVIDTIKDMSIKNARTLNYRFCHKKTIAEIAELENCNIRTVFRRFDKGLEEFEKQLIKKGFTEEKLEEEFGCINLLKAIKIKMGENEGYLTQSFLN